MSLETVSIALAASATGFALVVGMGAKLALSLAAAALVRERTAADYLELTVNGKDYSVDLRSIGNGGSIKIKNALAEAERCSEPV